MLQQPAFPVKTAGIAGETSVLSNDPVTGENDRDWIVLDCVSDSLTGHVRLSQCLCGLRGELAVADSLAVWDLSKKTPDQLLKGCPNRSQRQFGRGGLFSGKIPVQPAFCAQVQFSHRCVYSRFYDFFSKEFLILDPKSGDVVLIRNDQKYSNGRKICEFIVQMNSAFRKAVA